MDEKCKKYWPPCPPFSAGRASLLFPACMPSATLACTDHESPGKGGITFGPSPDCSAHPRTGVPLPRFDVPGPLMRTLRDPALSLCALSGVEPSEPVMVEVPLVQNNKPSTRAEALVGWRIGFSHRDLGAAVSDAFLQALDTLRSAGALLVPVDVPPHDEASQFSVRTHDQIDMCVIENRLDALVSDSNSAAFHAACALGHPKLGEPLGDGSTIWFYGARWAGDRLTVLVQGFRQLLQRPVQGATPGIE